MFCQPMISLLFSVRSRAYRGATLTTFDASRLIVLMMTAPHPSSNARPQTFAFVPGGPEPITKGLGSLMSSTVVARVGMSSVSGGGGTRIDTNEHESSRIKTRKIELIHS